MDTNKTLYESELLEKLRPRLTDEFLDTLKETAKIINSSDTVEIVQFLRDVYYFVGKELGEFKLYSDIPGFVYRDGSVGKGYEIQY